MQLFLPIHFICQKENSANKQNYVKDFFPQGFFFSQKNTKFDPKGPTVAAESCSLPQEIEKIVLMKVQVLNKNICKETLYILNVTFFVALKKKDKHCSTLLISMGNNNLVWS